MSVPSLVVSRLYTGFVMGLGLGLGYSFLHPVRPRWLGDLMFLPLMVWVWLELNFAVCDADLRLGYQAGPILGVWVFYQVI